jgi:CTP:molybdopterin cytidylyltransferase MocA
MQALYPQLYETPDRPIKIANRIEFGRNEWLRCQKIKSLIRSGNLIAIGKIMNAAWQESGSLYGIRTDAMDVVATIVKSVNGVYGVKVMGAGFGGSLLALVDDGALSTLSAVLKKESFSGSTSGEMLVHGVGRGLHYVDVVQSDQWDGSACLAAIILCGGKGSRMHKQGVETHKPLLPIDGIPSTKLVIERLQNRFGFEQIIVVVPPERVAEYEVVLDDEIEIKIQPVALGTGDAVHSILSHIDDNIEHLLVTFGSQPLVRDSTLAVSLKHHIDGNFSMTLPTTKTKNPYAPLIRDENGVVTGSLETHLDGVEVPGFGETNIGAYWVTKSALDKTLNQLWNQKWDEELGQYRTVSGELGFPNEMVNALVTSGSGVDGLAISDPEEVIGIKTPNHLEIIEQIEARRRRWD